MGMVVLPGLHDYWCTDAMFKTEWFSSKMSRDRFLFILRSLHLAPNNSKKNDTDKLHKVRPLMDILLKTFKTYWRPTYYISIDEGMIAFIGRCAFIQYMKDKPTKWGFKMWKLCDITGYLYCFDIYTGKKDTVKSNFGLAYDVVMNLVKKLPKATYHLFMDNFYTGIQLVRDLLCMNIYATGTVRANREGFPQSVRDWKVKNPGDSGYKMKDGVLAFKWKDTKDVCMLSTAHPPTEYPQTRRKKGTAEQEQRWTPLAAIDYRKYMGSVDRHDQYMESYRYNRKALKWWHPIFFYLLEAAITNMWIVKREYMMSKSKEPISQKQFRINLIHALIDQYAPAPNYNPTTSIQLQNVSAKYHFPVKLEERSTSRCICGCNRRSNYCCSGCKKPIFIDCFAKYHMALINE
jgi:hypothetical protein